MSSLFAHQVNLELHFPSEPVISARTGGLWSLGMAPTLNVNPKPRSLCEPWEGRDLCRAQRKKLRQTANARLFMKGSLQDDTESVCSESAMAFGWFIKPNGVCKREMCGGWGWLCEDLWVKCEARRFRCVYAVCYEWSSHWHMLCVLWRIRFVISVSTSSSGAPYWTFREHQLIF